MIEMVALFASDEEAREIVRRLESSSYKHFREAASTWVDCSTERQRICNRIITAQKLRQGTRYLGELSVADLESLASSLAVQLTEKPSSSISRKLGDVTRLIWSRFDIALELMPALQLDEA